MEHAHQKILFHTNNFHIVAYAEAVKRRKGAVREVKKETTKYAGEASGIKIGLKKSVRTKY